MPVLRSREIPPPQNPPSSKTLKKGFTGPSTPAKSVEVLGNQHHQEDKLASYSTPISRPLRRRSLRLASTCNAGENGSNSLSPTRKCGRNDEFDGNGNGGKGRFQLVDVKNESEFDSLDGARVSDTEFQLVAAKNERELDSLDGARVSDPAEENLLEIPVEVKGEGVPDSDEESGVVEIPVGVKEEAKLDEGKEYNGSIARRRKKGKIEAKQENKYLSLRSVTRMRTLESSKGDVLVMEAKTKVKDEKGKGVLVEGGSDAVLIIKKTNSKPKSTRKYTREEKGKGKLTSNVLVLNTDNVDKVKPKQEDKQENKYLSLRLGTRIMKRTLERSKGKVLIMEAKTKVKDEKGKDVLVEGGSEDVLIINKTNSKPKSTGKYTQEEKGKGKLTSNDLVLNTDIVDMVKKRKLVFEDLSFPLIAIQNTDGGVIMDNSASVTTLPEKLMLQENKPVTRSSSKENAGPAKSIMELFKDIARRNASRFAHFNAREEEENHVNFEAEVEEVPLEQPPASVEDWPGPFSTAMKIIRDREKNLNGQVKNPSSEKRGTPLVSWTPREKRDLEWSKRAVPSLRDLCLSILAKNVDAISSLKYVPDVLRHKLSQLLCDTRRMNGHFLNLLLEGLTSEIRVADCSWLEEDMFEKSFEGCDTNNLTVLQLDLCGHCISDSSLLKALMQKGLPALTTISLKGACRISDVGLSALVSSAPALRSMNLSQCSLLTVVAINNVANSLGSILRELYLDDCASLDAMNILPALKRLRGLEVLSLKGIGSVSDKFMKEFISSNGQAMKELDLANCGQLTDSSLKVIAETCSQLCVLDLSHLSKLTDIGMAHLANGCRGIQDLKLCRSAFSDDAIAAFIETSGQSLKELSLNNISKVGQNTTISLARRCKNLESLDLSWCRRLTDEALGLIADSCLSLRVLKLFGCTQVTRTFLDGHSNQHLHIIGMKLTPILEHIKRPDYQQGPLHYSAVPSV